MNFTPDGNSNKQYSSKAPTELFKTVSEVFTVTNSCKSPDLLNAVLQTCTHLLQYYQDGLKYILVILAKYC